MKTKLRRLNRSEFLLNNSIDDTFNTMLFPLNVLQTVIFDKKYRIRDKFITSNVKSTQLAAFCVIFIVTAFNLYQYSKTPWAPDVSKPLQITIFMQEQILEPVFLFANVAFTLYNSNEHVVLILKLQGLYKFTKCSVYKDCTLINWIGVVLVLGCHAGLLIFLYIDHKSVACFLVVLLVLNASTFCALRFVNLLRRNLMVWTDNIRQLQETLRTKTEIEIKDVNQSCAELFNYYKDILEAFNIVKKTFELVVRLSVHNTKTFSF